jgi:thiol-disulfide isomerase/thioredoxin
MKTKVFSVLLFFCFFFTWPLVAGEVIKEFGKSVIFSEDGPNIKLQELKGKVVVLVFFQSWCPKCNVWSGEKFKKIEEAFSKDKSILLVAIKTDTNSISDAKDYLKSRIKFENWIVGIDKGAEFYTKINGSDSLYRYAIINGKGELVENGSVGGNSLPSKKLGEGYFGTTFLPADQKYSSKFSKAILEAEVGSYKNALVTCRSFAKDREALEEAKLLEKNIYLALSEKIANLATTVRDPNAPNRFLAYLDLRNLAENLNGVKIQNEVIIVISEVKKRPYY